MWVLRRPQHYRPPQPVTGITLTQRRALRVLFLWLALVHPARTQRRNRSDRLRRVSVRLFVPSVSSLFSGHYSSTLCVCVCVSADKYGRRVHGTSGHGPVTRSSELDITCLSPVLSPRAACHAIAAMLPCRPIILLRKLGGGGNPATTRFGCIWICCPSIYEWIWKLEHTEFQPFTEMTSDRIIYRMWRRAVSVERSASIFRVDE
jgi:hypothetical protein